MQNNQTYPYFPTYQPQNINPVNQPQAIVVTIDNEGKIWQQIGTEKKIIGRTEQVYSELLEMAQEFKTKLEENGLIVKPKTTEEMFSEIKEAIGNITNRVVKIEKDLGGKKNVQSKQPAKQS